MRVYHGIKHGDTKARRHKGNRQSKAIYAGFFVPSCLCVSVFYLLRVLRFGARGVALREPGLPAFDCIGAAVATTVGRTDEVAVGESHPSDAAARTAI